MNYEDRLVAFIDILGFKNLVGETVDAKGVENTDKIAHLYESYEIIQQNWSDLQGLSESKRVTIFSDCVVVSVKVSETSQIFWTLLEIKHLIMQLVWRGILVRGALVRGKLIHDTNKVFGPALVEAYLLESKAAHYPRVILDRSLVKSASEARAPDHTIKDEENHIKALLEQDSDGMYYIDYFFKASEELVDSEYEFPEYISSLGEIIRKGLMGSSHQSKADLRVKFSWMRERYNRMVDSVKPIRGSIENAIGQDNDLYQFYVSLKKISPDRQ
jgi:hypothetical protein